MALDPSNFLSYATWLSLPQETRLKIMKLFDINFSIPRHTVDSRVMSDGVNPQSLSVITREKMREITGLKTEDFYELFQALVDKLEAKVAPQEETQNVQQEKPAEAVAPAKAPAVRKGRPRKAA